MGRFRWKTIENGFWKRSTLNNNNMLFKYNLTVNVTITLLSQ